MLNLEIFACTPVNGTNYRMLTEVGGFILDERLTRTDELWYGSCDVAANLSANRLVAFYVSVDDVLELVEPTRGLGGAPNPTFALPNTGYGKEFLNGLNPITEQHRSGRVLKFPERNPFAR